MGVDGDWVYRLYAAPGSPMRAFNSLNRVGASSLSNEIASGAIFFAVGGLGWLLAALKKLPSGLRALWLIVTMVLGVVFVWMMVRVYNTIDTVPTGTASGRR